MGLGSVGIVGGLVVCGVVCGGKVGECGGGVKAWVAAMEGVLRETLSVFGLVHALEEIEHGVDGGEQVARVSGFGDGVHIADRETDGGGGAVDGSENTRHGVGACVASDDGALDRDLVFEGDLLDQGVEFFAGDGSDRKRKALSHCERWHPLAFDAGCCDIIVIDIDPDQDIGFGDGGHHTATHTSDLFVGGDAKKCADIFEPSRLGDKTGDLSGRKATKAVVEVGPIKSLRAKAALDRAIEQHIVAHSHTKGFNLLLFVFAVDLEFEIDLFFFDAAFARTKGFVGKVDRADGFDGSAFDGAIVPGIFGIFAEQQNFVSDQGGGQEGIGIKPDLAVFSDLTYLHTDLVGVSDKQDSQQIVAVGCGIKDDSCISTKGVDLPACAHPFFKVGDENAERHGGFEADRTGGGQDIAHDRELFFGHRLFPRLLCHDFTSLHGWPCWG